MKLYIVTRSDLTPGARAAQSAHAAILFQHQHVQEAIAWHHESNNLVLLEAPGEGDLRALAARAQHAGISVSVFQEPDMGNAVTAIAIGAGGARLVSSLPLALRVEKERAA